MSDRRPTLLSRREAMQRVIELAGCAMTVAELGLVMPSMAEATNGDPFFLSHDQFDDLACVVDLMIPATDTPGALEAGVPRFMDRMLADWASEESRGTLMRAIREVQDRAEALHGRPLSKQSAEQQLAALQRIDREAYESGDDASPYRQLKALILFSYYSSEIGASVELRYNPVPGDYPGCVPLDAVGRAWNEHWGM